MEKKIKPRVRLVIIKDNKLLVTYTSDGDFYFYIGGKMEFGETIEECCQREIFEECGEDIKFIFQKILYIREYIIKDKDEHSIELFVLGDLDKTEGIEQKIDEEYPDTHKQVWLDMDNLPDNLLPKALTQKLVEDYKNGFPTQGEYLGSI